MINKIFGVLIIVVALGLGYMVLEDDFRASDQKSPEVCIQLTPAQQLIKMIDDDFQELGATGQLSEGWKSISAVEVRMNSNLAKTLLGKERPHFAQVKEGSTSLELEIMDLPDEENPGVIIQASLFDIKSKNKIFEIGRTYTMNELNKVVPAEAPTTPQNPPSPQQPTGTDQKAPAASQPQSATPNKEGQQ